MQADSAATATRLASAPISASGAGLAAFAPLPQAALAALLAGVGGPPPGVSSSSSSASEPAVFTTTFLSTAFSPYRAAADAGNTVGAAGITRLAFARADRSEIEMHALGAPITFSLPPVPIGANRTSGCAWWNATAGAFSSSGCAALPAVLPPDTTASWSPVSNLSSGGVSAALPWTLNGMDSTCSMTVLDCPRDPAALVYLDLWAPLQVPGALDMPPLPASSAKSVSRSTYSVFRPCKPRQSLLFKGP